jgi:hypothetical protein
MSQTDVEAYLRRFQECADTASLLEYIRLKDGDAARYQTAFQVLLPVFDPVHHGEYPRYHDLDLKELSEYENEIVFIASRMAQSDKADLQSCGAELLRLVRKKD